MAAVDEVVLAQLNGRAPSPEAVRSLPGCLSVRLVPGGEPVYELDLEVNAVKQWAQRLLWHDGTSWRIQPLQAERWPQSITPVYAADGELIAYAQGHGSGGVGHLQLYKLGSAMRLLWESEQHYDHISAIGLSRDVAITIGRAPETWEEPHAIMANCCLPVDRATLWRRSGGGGFMPTVTTVLPNPYRTVSLFVGALKRGDVAFAARFAADAEVVARGAAAVDAADGLTTQEWEADLTGSILEAEARHWEAVPEALRGPAPAVTRVVWPSGKHEIVTERRQGKWLVTAVRPAR